MTFICCVCHEVLTTNPDEDEPVGAVGGGGGGDQEVDIVVTKCGHMYHLVCLTRWFNSQANPLQECPYCHTAVGNTGYQRVFPAGDEATDRELAAGRTKAQANVQEIQILRKEHEEFSAILAERQNALKNECLALETLQMDHAVKLSELDQANEELQREVVKRRDLVNQLDELERDFALLFKEKEDQSQTLEDTERRLELLRTDFEKLLNDKLALTDKLNDLESEKAEWQISSIERQRVMTRENLASEDKKARQVSYEKCKNSLKAAQRLLDELCIEEFPDPKDASAAIDIKPNSQFNPKLNLSQKPTTELGTSNGLSTSPTSSSSSSSKASSSPQLINLVEDEIHSPLSQITNNRQSAVNSF